MSTEIIQELKAFFKGIGFSGYEIEAYITLLNSTELTAREISHNSGIPTGRIYDVLNSLKEKGMLEEHDSRPKKYLAISPNKTLENVIFHQRDENQRRFSSYLERAKELERKLENQPWDRTREDSRVFWSIAYGILPITSLYEKKMAELKTELLLTGFLNERSLKLAPLAKTLNKNISTLLNRGIQIKYLWSFECDERPLGKADIQTVQNIFNRLRVALREWTELPNTNFFQMRYVTKRIPTYYDIFDEKRVLVKMQNPLDATQIFACINILDPTLALGLRARFLNLWTYEAHE